MLPIESSLSGPVDETHDLLYDSSLSITGETILPIRHCLVGPGAFRSRRSRSSARTRPRSTSAAGSSRRCPGRRRSPRRRPPTPRTRSPRRRPDRGRDRERAGGGDVRAHRDRRRRRRPSRGVHALRLRRAVHAARPGERGVANGVLVRHRPPAGRAPPCDRAVRAPPARPRPARLATDPPHALALSLRRRAGRPPARPGRQRDARRGDRPDARAARLRLLSVTRQPASRRARSVFSKRTCSRATVMPARS